MLANETAPGAWVERAEELLARLTPDAAELPALPAPKPMMAMDETEAQGKPGEVDGERQIEEVLKSILLKDLWVEVDTGDHTLTLWRKDEMVRQFPVGLGANNATPEGDFVIANHIYRPDWYNRGKVVAYGDPRNPLGDYWMGLSAPGAPQGIGIHPTEAAGSIGKNESRGCIRMFPEDAGKLFQFCRVGTRVRIHS